MQRSQARSTRPFVPTLCVFASLVALATSAHAQSLFASSVVDYSPGPGGGTFVASNILGGPTGGGFSAGSLDVTTLGVGGSITVGFDVTISDGPGADFSVFENGFEFGGEVFSEVAWVEVSSDNVLFARFPSSYAGPQNGFSGFTAPFGTYAGLTGGDPVLANVQMNNISPFDPVVSGGEAFDLAELALDPLVLSHQVDLAAIHYVRIVDIPHASGLDSHGNVIWDNSGPTGTADIDAVAVIQHAGTLNAHQPSVDLFFDANGYLNLKLEDPDGLADIDRSTLQASFNFVPTRVSRLRGLLPVVATTANSILMRSASPIAGSGIKGILAVSARDFAGNFSADQIALQG